MILLKNIFSAGAIRMAARHHLHLLLRSFNSYIVQLGFRRGGHIRRVLTISIPIWCNWDCNSISCRIFYFLFQFLYGAIGITNSLMIQMTNNRFNSYMVQLG